MLSKIQREIVFRILNGRCTLFVGAGLSMGSGLPSWQTLIEDLRDVLSCPDVYDFPTLAQAYEKVRGREDLVSRICRLTDATGKEPTRVHRLLPRLGIPTWITTNYDNILEVCLRDSGQPASMVVIEDKDLAHFDRPGVRLIKIHGDRLHPASILFTKNDLFAVRQKQPLLWGFMQTELAQNSMLFLGYSMSDPDFNQVQTELLHVLGTAHLRTSYAVMFGADKITTADFETRNISPVDLGPRTGDVAADTHTLAEFLEPIANLLQQTPPPTRESHDAAEASTRVPPELQAQLQDEGYRLVCCIEYRTYCAMFDEAGFIPIPAGWTPVIDDDYPAPDYRCTPYDRSDKQGNNIWKGWAIGKKQDKARPDPCKIAKQRTARPRTRCSKHR